MQKIELSVSLDYVCRNAAAAGSSDKLTKAHCLLLGALLANDKLLYKLIISKTEPQAETLIDCSGEHPGLSKLISYVASVHRR